MTAKAAELACVKRYAEAQPEAYMKYLTDRGFRKAFTDSTISPKNLPQETVTALARATAGLYKLGGRWQLRHEFAARTLESKAMQGCTVEETISAVVVRDPARPGFVWRIFPCPAQAPTPQAMFDAIERTRAEIRAKASARRDSKPDPSAAATVTDA